MFPRKIRLLACAGLIATSTLMPAHAGVVVGGTRVVFNEGSKEQTIQITNQGKVPAMVQSWIDDGDANARPRTIRVPFVLTPPLTRLDPGQGQTLRLTYLPMPDKPMAADRATVYYLNVLEIPPAPEASQGENTLQLAVRTRIKLFFRPSALQGLPRDAAGKLRWQVGSEAESDHIDVTNPTHYYVSINEATLPDGRVTKEPAMVPPHSSVRMAIGDGRNDKRPEAGKVAFQWIDDYGATVDTTTAILP
ncbi:molecular chaperone FimB [Rothia nasimurium]|uniref:Fimbria/pilus periplasmic chaperone n=1 Tax=Luteibacter anthropi TaxID=564369 RepID=A0A7X5UDQ1_9GAMM|nr:fimbria/pilus periplasmic chaperone [Luteibacter anthropi]NII08620.1 fimbria/pilus periplasmic chaperone [Luteibacter anthropi]